MEFILGACISKARPWRKKKEDMSQQIIWNQMNAQNSLFSFKFWRKIQRLLWYSIVSIQCVGHNDDANTVEWNIKNMRKSTLTHINNVIKIQFSIIWIEADIQNTTNEWNLDVCWVYYYHFFSSTLSNFISYFASVHVRNMCKFSAKQ